MRNIDSLKNSSQFKEVYQKGRSKANNLLVLYVLKTQEGQKLGISASKKIGNSVIRHRAIRLIRESFVEIRDSLPDGIILVAVARQQIKGKSQAEVKDALLALCRKHRLV